MSSCRSTSFYVAPGLQYYFATTTLATYHKDSWHEFTHRRDLETFQQAHPDWDQLCYVVQNVGSDGIEVIKEAIVRKPESVEIWKIDTRVVNGRSPSGAAPALFALAYRGLSGAGGANLLTDRVFPEPAKTLRRASQAISTLPGAHLALAAASSLRPHIGDAACATLLDNATAVASAINYAPVDPALLTAVYGKLTQHYPATRCASLISEVTTLAGLDESARYALAAHTDSSQLLAALARDPSYRVRAEVGRRPITPLDALDLLASDLETGAPHPVAENPATRPETLCHLSTSENTEVRAKVASNPSTTPETLAKLGVDEYWDVCAAVARNPHCPPETLAILRAENWNMLTEIVANPACSPSEVASLIDGEDYAVHIAAIKNPNCPPEILLEISTRMNWAERREVVMNPACPVAILTSLAIDDDWDVREAVADHPATPANILRLLSNDEDEVPRLDALANPNCPPDALAAKSNSEDYRDRRAVARNPASPPEVLQALSTDVHLEVQMALGKNPACPPELRVAILSKSSDPDNWALAAVLCTTHRLPPVVSHPSVTHLKEAAVIAQRDLEATGVTWPSRPKSITDLPGRASLPWDVASTTDALVGRRVHPRHGQGFTVRRLDSKTALEQNANYMGNCTAGYAHEIAQGDTIILALDDHTSTTVYNVELYRRVRESDLSSDGTRTFTKSWYLGQVNSRFNNGGAPPWLMRKLESLVRNLPSEPGPSAVELAEDLANF